MKEDMIRYNRPLPKMPSLNEFKGNRVAWDERAPDQSLKYATVQWFAARRIAVESMNTGNKVEDVLFRNDDYNCKVPNAHGHCSLKCGDCGDGELIYPGWAETVRELARKRVMLWGQSTKLLDHEAFDAVDFNDEKSESGAGVSLLLIGDVERWNGEIDIPGAVLTVAGDGLTRLDLFDGNFANDNGYVNIYSKSSPGSVFTFNIDDVSRAHGYKGEVWQNVDYDWNGKKREEESEG